MLQEYFVQLGIIIFPITAYMIWTFGKSFNQLPYRTWILGLYGGGAAILCQVMPVHILGKTENFQCIPIILSILYGKRRAGLLSMGILAGYQMLVIPQLSTMLWSIAGIIIYSAAPMAFCIRFDHYRQRDRFWLAQLLSVGILLIELLFILVLFSVRFGSNGINELSNYFTYLGIACVIQLVMLGVAFFLLENIIQNGRNRDRQAAIFRYNPLGICVFDTGMNFVSVNPAYEAITGYKESELWGRSRLYLWFEEDYGQIEQIPQGPGGIIQNAEVALKHKDGHRIPVRFTMLPMMEGESVIGYFAMVTDITESKAAEEYMRNTEKLSVIGQLAAGVAHEIRNPLTAIKGFLQLLSTSNAASPARYFDIIKTEITRIECIVSEMLVLAKPQAVLFRPVDIREKLIEVAALLEREAHMQNVEILTDLQAACSQVMADENQLKQVFLNLGKNAIEAMPQGGKLHMILRREKDQIAVCFMDSGHGIPQEILNRIGEPFFTTKATGTGLGFLTSKRIVSNHQGDMRISSVDGEGTTVELVFPAQEDAAAAIGEAAAAAES